MTDIVQKVVEYLEKDENPDILDLRVTYTHAGVKVNISYVANCEKQKKPFPTLIEALTEALISYEERLEYRINYAKEDMNSENENIRKFGEERIELYNKHLPNARKALAYVQFVS